MMNWKCGRCCDEGFSYQLFNAQVEIYTNHKPRQTEDICTTCSASSTCSILPPSESRLSQPCYQGPPSDASKAYNTDPFIDSTSTWFCGTCAAKGYDHYIHNDPVFRSMELWDRTSSLVDIEQRALPKLACANCILDSKDTCALVPPKGSLHPCYQGAPVTAFIAYNTDPLISNETTWACNNCSDNGYPVYIQDDPVYDLGIWYKKIH
jgi:hypothetical protein